MMTNYTSSKLYPASSIKQQSSVVAPCCCSSVIMLCPHGTINARIVCLFPDAALFHLSLQSGQTITIF